MGSEGSQATTSAITGAAGTVVVAFEGTKQTIGRSSLHSVGVSALRCGSYSIDEMNEEFAFIVLGKAPMIVWTRPGASRDEELRLITIDAFRALSENARHEYVDDKGKARSISYANKWLADERRQDFAGIEFFPNPDGAEGKRDFLNLWRGFSVEPKATGSYAVFRDHLLTNVCNGNADLFRWLFGWFAQIVQQPRRKPGTSIVLRGGMGVGKTIVGQVFGSLFANHFVLADDARYLTGNFNAHMVSCLLLEADEATWAGDKAAEGRLKGLITSTTQMIEGKGIDPICVDNHLRVLMTSNNDWVVPAGKDERRFAIFDVAGYSAQNHEYFGELMEEIETGGRERLLHDLLAYDLSNINLREIPKTEALMGQKIHSLDPVDSWLLDRLHAGVPTRGHRSWPEFCETRVLVDDYVAASEKVGVHRRSSETQFAMRFTKLMPGAKRCRQSQQKGESDATERVYGYLLPPLDDARRDFEDAFGQPIAWHRDDE